LRHSSQIDSILIDDDLNYMYSIDGSETMNIWNLDTWDLVHSINYAKYGAEIVKVNQFVVIVRHFKGLLFHDSTNNF